MNAAEITAVCLSVWGIAVLFAMAFIRGADTRRRDANWS